MDVGYGYNIRGWLTGITGFSQDTNSEIFAMDLEYDNAPTDHEAYNGNIGSIAWRNPYETLVNRYDYGYDEMNRLSLADYSAVGSNSKMGFSVSDILYDLNGNIQALQRKGNDELYNPNTTIDNLAYTYAYRNQLGKVSDSSGKTAGFKDGADQSEEYLYDDNGNMHVDRNKGITSIEYNILNLPGKVIFSPDKYVEYTYDASGTKHSKKSVDGDDITVTDYMSGMVFENDHSQFLQHDEGRAMVRRNEEGVYDSFRYYYDMKGHLGNVRFTFHTNWTSTDTALRDIKDLVEKGILRQK